MTLSTANLRSRIRLLENTAGQANRYVVAFSGGIDSSALLHCLKQLLAKDGDPSGRLIAIHIDHGLHVDSVQWARHCQEFAAMHDIECRVVEVAVAMSGGKGPEAAARTARYAALEAELVDGDWLMTAHHQDDQAETLLLNLLRGSGPAGIAGIGAARRFGTGWLLRPLLDFGQQALARYASNESLNCLEDPSNANRDFDRNFLRHDVMPHFAERWPNVASRLSRSASRAGEAAELLFELARIDAELLDAPLSRLPIDGLKTLSPARQRNLIRYACRELGLAAPTADALQRVIREVIPARVDAEPLVTWPGASVRRYRNALYLMPENLTSDIETGVLGSGETALGPGLGSLKLVGNAEVGVSRALVSAGLSVKVRQGGEEIKLQGQAHTRKLKKLLQEEGIVPWMRDRLPLLYCGEQLVAVADLWLADDAVAKPGVAVQWIDRPALH